MKRALAACAAALLAAGCSSGQHFVVHRNGAPAWQVPTKGEIKRLRNRLIWQARFYREPHPKGGLLVAVWGSRCNRATEFGDEDVYLASAWGHFTFWDWSHPFKGSRLVLAFDAHDLSLQGAIGWPRHPRMTRCGPWVSLDLGD